LDFIPADDADDAAASSSAALDGTSLAALALENLRAPRASAATSPSALAASRASISSSSAEVVAEAEAEEEPKGTTGGRWAVDRRERDSSGRGPQRKRECERRGEAVGDPHVSRESLAFSSSRAAAALRGEGPAVRAPEDDAAWLLLLRRRRRRRGNVWQAQRGEEQHGRGRRC